MAVFSGPVWRDGEAQEGFVRVAKGRVAEEGPGLRPGAKPAVILDGLHNFHTHLGDAFLRGRPLPRSLEALVKPGAGYKHRMLAAAKPSSIIAGMRRALQLHEAAGTASLLDFREQGVPGVALAREALRRSDTGIALRLLGRPTGPAGAGREAADVVAASDGLGLSSLTDLGPSAATYADECRRARKPLAIHASEQRREPMRDVLSLDPQLLVHLVHATPADLRLVRDAGVPAALCPTSNRFFRLKSPIRRLRRAGVPFHFGTDNAMLGDADLVREARLARELDAGVSDESLLRALTTGPEKAIKRIHPLQRPPDGPQPIVLLPLRRGRVQWRARPFTVQR